MKRSSLVFGSIIDRICDVVPGRHGFPTLRKLMIAVCFREPEIPLEGAESEFSRLHYTQPACLPVEVACSSSVAL